MVDIQWVGQTDPKGCGAAVLAMLTGISYTAVKLSLAHLADFVKDGIGSREMDHFLAGEGYAVQRKYNFLRNDELRVPWPPEPWADLHVCHVKVYEDSPMFHFVVLLGNGMVLDPLVPEPRTLDFYHHINNIAAVVKVPPIER